MLILSRKSDGKVVYTSPTNSLFPDGVPIETIDLDNHGIQETWEELDALRIHDEDDSEIVNKTYTHAYTIQDGQVVFGELKPIPEPVPQPPTEIELLRLETAQANAEMFEMVLMMTGGMM